MRARTLVALALAFCGCASFRPLDPAAGPIELGPDEGILLVHVKTDVPLSSIQASGYEVVGIPVRPGQHLLPVAATPGAYRWRRLEQETAAGRYYYRLVYDEYYDFSVEPGVINYPGLLWIESGEQGSLRVAAVNRTGAALLGIEKRYPQLLDRFPAEFTATRPDPFMRHYLAKRRGRRPSPAGTISTATVSLRARVKADELISEIGVRQVVVSPTGDWVAARVVHGEHSAEVVVQRRNGTGNVPVHASGHAIHHVEWVGDDTLLVQHAQMRVSDPTATVIRLRWHDRKIEHEAESLWGTGYFVAKVGEGDAEVLWSRPTRNGTALLRGPISAMDRNAHGARQVAHSRLAVVRWIPDRSGTPRAFLAFDGEWPETEMIVGYRSVDGRKWREASRTSHEEPVYPLAFSADGERIVVATRADRDTLGLHEMDPATGEIARTIYVLPDRDLVDVVLSSDRLEVVGAVYEQDGIRRHAYLDGFAERRIAPTSAQESVEVTSTSRDRRFAAILAHGPTHPGTFYFVDRRSDRRFKVGDVLFEVSPDELAGVEAFRAESADGTRVEAFFSAPPKRAGERPPPLLVMPHGGPISVRDDASFDPLQQLLVTEGIAVLKVNYRGSAGYGRTFEEAGARQWSKGIEDDVDAAVRSVIDRGLVDPERICIAGASYGGYSALMSVIRWPDRYRCAATLNAATDVPLIFHSSDFAATEMGRQHFAKLVGDPETELDELISISPVYRADEIDVPVLIVYGSHDFRVDPDHSVRLRAMLDLDAKPYRWLELRRTGHSLSITDYRRFAVHLLDFLAEPLGLEQLAY